MEAIMALAIGFGLMWAFIQVLKALWRARHVLVAIIVFGLGLVAFTYWAALQQESPELEAIMVVVGIIGGAYGWARAAYRSSQGT